MKPQEKDYTNFVGYCRDLEIYCNGIEEQLAAALAACKQKDEALKLAKTVIGHPDDYGSKIIAEALAIQPDDSALRARIVEELAETEEACKDQLARSAERNAKLRLQLETMTQAVGLATTIKGDMVIDVSDPIGMMQRVCAEVDGLRRQLANKHQALRTVYEVWAGSEGVFNPESATETHLMTLVAKMRDAAKDGMK